MRRKPGQARRPAMMIVNDSAITKSTRHSPEFMILIHRGVGRVESITAIFTPGA